MQTSRVMAPSPTNCARRLPPRERGRRTFTSALVARTVPWSHSCMARPAENFATGELIASGTIDDADVIERPGFNGTVATLVERMRQGRAYANLHTTANPAGEVRGQIVITDRQPVSHYSDPEFSWKFEVAPAAVGFIRGRE